MEASFESKKRLDFSDYNSKESIPDSFKSHSGHSQDDKYEQLKAFYEQRLESITAFAHKFYDIVQKDEVLMAMQGNTVSEKFANQRLRELYEETMLKECEFTIQNLQNELISLRMSLTRQESDKSKYLNQVKVLEDSSKASEQDLKRLERENYDLKSKINLMRSEFEEAIKRRDKELTNKYEDLKGNLIRGDQVNKEKTNQELESTRYSLERERNKVKSLEDEIRKLKKDLDKLQDLEDSGKRFERIADENEILKTKCARLEDQQEKLQKQAGNYEKQLKTILSAEQKASNEALTSLQTKYKTRAKAFKKKIIEQKQTIEGLDQQLKSYKHGLEDYKKSIEKKSLGSQDDLKRVKDEWEKRCNELQLEYQRKEAELSTKQQIQLVSLQNQYQQLLEERVQEIQREMNTSRAKVKENEFKAIMEEKLKDFVSRAEYEEIFREKERLIKTCEKFTNQTAAFEKEFEKVIKERALIEKSLEIEREKVRDLEERDDEKKKRIQAEEKVSVLLKSIAQFRQLVEEKEDEMESMGKRLKELRNLMTTMEIDLENERSKSLNLKKEAADLKVELQNALQEKENLENKLILQESQLEIEGRRKKNEGIERFEEEVARHSETKTKLIQVEAKLAQANRDLEEFDKKFREVKEIGKGLEAENSKLRKKVVEYDNEINIERISSQEMQKKVERLTKTSFGKIEKFHKIKTVVAGFKSLLKTLKVKWADDLMELKKDNSSSIQDLLFRFIDNSNYMRKQLEIRYQAINDEMNQEWVRKVQSIEENINKHANSSNQQSQEKILAQEKFIETLKASLQTCKKDQKSSNEELEKARKKLQETLDQASNLEKEKKVLEEALKKNASAFDSLQTQIKKETNKIQQSHEAALDRVKKELEKKHSQEIQEIIQKTKTKDSQGEIFIREKLKEIDNLKEEEVFQIKKKYQELLDAAYQETQTEKEKNSKLKQKLNHLDEEVVSLKQDQIKTTSEFEERIKFIEKHSKMEIEVLTSQLQNSETRDSKLATLELDLSEKTEEINLLRKEREKIRNKLRELEEKVEIQSKNFQNQLGLKDKEIESLRHVVNRSYSESLDQLKRAQELDLETKELTRQARKGTSSRNSTYSYSSEISKPI